MKPRSRLLLFVLLLAAALRLTAAESASPPDRATVLATVKRATTFMVEKAGYQGGYVWQYLPDFSRRWGEMEAFPTMMWIQPPGTPAMGNLFLDAYHVTGDEYYYRAAEQTGVAMVKVQHPTGGWNYIADLAGEESLKKWYATIGRHGWRLEEFQHYYGNATFDDSTTVAAARFMLRLALEKKDPRFQASLERALKFILDSQFPVGAWPQRYPPAGVFSKDGNPDYSSYITLNDAVTGENIAFLFEAHAALGDSRYLAAARRGMDAIIALQQPPPQAGWALQYTPDLKPAAARTYEPKGLATHATANSIANLLEFHALTGDRKYLAPIPAALAWLDSVKLPPNLPGARGSHPTFVELGTNRPIFIHRRGSNAISGRYYTDHNPADTVGHYSSFRSVDTTALRTRYEAALAKAPAELLATSPLRPNAPREMPARIVSRGGGGGGRGNAGAGGERIAQLVSTLNAAGYWPAVLRSTSHPYKPGAPTTPTPGDFSRANVGDEYDTSPHPATSQVMGISTSTYIGNVATLLRHVDALP